MIEKLKYLDAISFIQEIPTEGHSPLLILTEDFDSYYIKHSKGQTPATYLINEFLCHYFLKLWNLNSPDISAIKVDTNILPETLSQYHKLYFYEHVTFGSKRLDNVIEMNNLINIDGKADLNKFENPEDLIKLSLFDIWVENDDRKPTNPNVLFDFSEKKIKIVAIDNAFTFSTMDYDSLYIEGVSQSFNDNLLYSNFVKSICKYLLKQNGWTNYIKDYFYLCIQNCKENFNEITENIPNELGLTDDLKEHLYSFLFNENRNKLVLTDFYSRLK
ncbi:HipA family kinase [Marinifilum flexuosum]|uniref:HipA-like kinase domain-containing protein n=1 Tax=Marinifilum flexuosum TaxID=1117708 RepID=A0A419X9P5_9BACT|nr:HipA family kinase [Marinifilum flexuosum]RKE04435.1 hypothetical protein BXY64_1455 [Marinifilum flexuosum]